ncbi:outer membrane lipoprotein carrier protein LolA [Agaribacterium sp. ZY112]|uniref:outer membrane lipoprotein carrier protein LolA n=1 Tax=Agaribacterium sp. ZY112 TaxID=3233574 RepID=UPI003525B21D
MTLYRTYVLLLPMLLSLAVRAVELPEAPNEPVLSGSFQQQRLMQGFSRPMLSSGHFVFWRERGVLWQLELPFVKTTTYLSDETLSWTTEGQLIERKISDQIEKEVAAIIIALLGADYEHLQRRFILSYTEDAQVWSINLQPKDQLLAEYLESIDISGRDFIDTLSVHSSNGDTNVTSFVLENRSLEPSVKAQPFFMPNPGINP